MAIPALISPLLSLQTIRGLNFENFLKITLLHILPVKRQVKPFFELFRCLTKTNRLRRICIRLIFFCAFAFGIPHLRLSTQLGTKDGRPAHPPAPDGICREFNHPSMPHEAATPFAKEIKNDQAEQDIQTTIA
jgi:hypothetical protein